MVTVSQAAIWPRRRRVPEIGALGFILACSLFSLVSQNGFDPEGDGPYYLLMQQAWLINGWPSAEPNVIEQVAQRPDIGHDYQWWLLADGVDDRRYGIHFWFYSLLSTPFAVVLQMLGQDPLWGFFALNLLCAAAAGLTLVRSASLSTRAKVLVLLCFGVTSLNWYAAWPHPEVYTASLLLIASVALLEGRMIVLGVCSGLAALQNPSAIMLLPVAALGAVGSVAVTQQGPAIVREFVKRAWPLALGAGIASVAPLFSVVYLGTLNPIAAAGFVDFSQLTLAMFGHYLFDLDQGALPGLPFLFIGGMAAIAFRVRRKLAGQEALFQRADWLLLAALLISVPVLTQDNFNSGQYYVLRYVSWTLIPALVWLATQFDRSPLQVGLAWGAGVAVYTVAFSVFLATKLMYVVQARADPTLPGYSDSLQLKPWTRVVLEHAPSLYNPWPGTFAERVLGREVLEERPADLPIGYRRADGAFTKILADDSEHMFRCGDGIFEPLSPDGSITVTAAHPGLVYLNGQMRCVSLAMN